MPIIKGGNHVSIQRIVILTECTEKFGVNDWCMVSLHNSITCEANHDKFEKLVQGRCAHKSP